ncbi:trypsin-like serine protease [Corallococcus terminator]|uniref:Peptidase S1 n=1 Tax=Corallococcus terminator TaxID=2316733 RepID=A0A3A8JDG7_9BACT|nr:trypsin-like serine protease [Corallococcus terminator]RKG93762.1 peptidase S1 [Corallococcus terminator]
MQRFGAGSAQLSTMASTGQVVQVADVLRYPGFTTPSQGKDVALLRLATPLTLNGSTVAAIPLATPADETAGYLAPGLTATVTGWGLTALSGPFSLPDTLRKLDLPIVSNASAIPVFGFITADQLATGTPALGGPDTCQGDNGGPVVVNGASGKILAGVVSWGSNSCGRPNTPRLHARIPSFQTWLTDAASRTPTSLLSQPGLAGLTGTWTHFSVTVPAGAASLNVALGDGTGNGDLYVHTATPTTGTYTCRSNGGGNAEYCSIPSPAAGTWYVSVLGTADYADATLRATGY